MVWIIWSNNSCPLVLGFIVNSRRHYNHSHRILLWPQWPDTLPSSLARVRTRTFRPFFAIFLSRGLLRYGMTAWDWDYTAPLLSSPPCTDKNSKDWLHSNIAEFVSLSRYATGKDRRSRKRILDIFCNYHFRNNSSSAKSVLTHHELCRAVSVCVKRCLMFGYQASLYP